MKRLVSLIGFFVFLIGCGGGTSGTGLDSVGSGSDGGQQEGAADERVLVGRVVTRDGRAVPGVRITLVSGSASTALPLSVVTNGRGEFTITLTSADYPLQLVLDGQTPVTLAAPSANFSDEVILEVETE